MHDLTDFPSDKLQQRQSVSPCKFSEQNLKNFTIRGRFSKNTPKLLIKFPGLTISGRHTSAAMITDRRKFTTRWSL